MPTYFPQINASGVMVQRPYTTAYSYRTTAQDQETGRRFGYAWRDEPMARWSLEYQSITEDEVAVLEQFFAQMSGRFGEFCYLDPGGNLVRHSEDFSANTWERYDSAVGAAAADPFGGQRASIVTGGGNGMMATYVLPEGDAAGRVLCGSVWAKSAGGGSLVIGFIDAGFNVLWHREWALPAGQWRRIHASGVVPSGSPVRLLIGGFGSWAGQTLSIFGAQAVPMPGPGAYARTPGRYGLYPRCRFDTDRFEVRYVGPRECRLSLSIAEVR